MKTAGAFLFIVFSFLLTTNALAKDQKSVGPFLLLSPAFEPKAELPKKYSCNGSDTNPPLEIYNPPPKTASLAITFQDLDAPEGIWTHWVVYNIPPDKLSVMDNNIPGYQLLSDFGKYAYAGPCPLDDKPHRLIFTAYALNVVLENNEGWTIVDLKKAMRGHILAQNELPTMYRKSAF